MKQTTNEATERLSVGLIGGGQIAVDAHLPVLLASAGARVDWILDRDNERARVVARSAGIVAVDFGAVAAGTLPAADVVLLAIPYGARRPYYEALSGSKAAVYVEKPFAVSLAEHRELSALFPSSRLACGFQRRSMGTSAALREVIRTKLYGNLESVQVEFGSPVTRAGSYQSNLALAGGGLLLDVGLHALDLALFVANASRAEVTSVEMIREEGFDVHTNARISATQEGGGTFEIELLCSSLRFTRLKNVYRFEHAEVSHDMWGSGALTVRPNDSPLSFRMSGRTVEIPQTSNQIFHRHWQEFFTAIRSGIPNYACAIESELTTSVVERIYAGGH